MSENHGQRFVTFYRREGSRPSPRNRNEKRKNGCPRWLDKYLRKKRSERQRRKGKIYPSECRVPKNSKVRKESVLK